MAFVLGIAMPYVMAGNLLTSVTNPYDNRSESVENIVIQYHLAVNKLTNEFIDTLLSEEKPNVNYVNNDEECESGNVSTYCLAVVLNAELENFELAIVQRKSDVTYQSNDSDTEGGTEIRTLEQAIEANAKQQSFIEEEVMAARDTLDLTLAVYNQIQIVYPVHKEFQKVIGSLETYNKKLAEIRKSVELFPSKFNDASTVSCE